MIGASIDVSLSVLALHAAAQWSVICWLCPPRFWWLSIHPDGSVATEIGWE